MSLRRGSVLHAPLVLISMDWENVTIESFLLKPSVRGGRHAVLVIPQNLRGASPGKSSLHSCIFGKIYE